MNNSIEQVAATIVLELNMSQKEMLRGISKDELSMFHFHWEHKVMQICKDNEELLKDADTDDLKIAAAMIKVAIWNKVTQ